MPDKAAKIPQDASLTASPQTAPLVPRRVGEWLLEDQIGGGAFGTVWRARHHVWADQLAAVKLPHNAEYVRALRREGVYAHRLDHPNIVRALGFDPFAEVPYLVMEHVPGTDLRRVLRDGPLSSANAMAVLSQVLAALSYAHTSGVHHLDIKPENILVHIASTDPSIGLGGAGVVKVTDFGLGQADQAMARHHDPTRQQSIVFSTDLSSEAGQKLAGSLDYMSPEQRRGENIDGRADLYACGVLLFEMLTGERPAGTDVPSNLNKQVPAHLDEIFRRSYARLENRFKSADEFIEALGPAGTRPGDRLVPVESKPGKWAVRNMDANLREAGFDPVAAHAEAERLAGHPLSAAGCPGCGGRTDAHDQFCMQCGKQLVNAVRRCGKCGAFPSPGDNFCMFCGHNLVPRQLGKTGTDVHA